MEKTYFSPGPSQLYPGVESFIADGLEEGVGSISHRSAEYVKIHESAVEGLRNLINLPDSWDVYFLGSASESWERIIRNCILSESYHFVNGSFSKKFYSYAIAEGLNANKHEVEEGQGFDIDQVHIPEKTELITIAHNETSTGVMTPLEDVYKLRETHEDAIIALDVVSSLPFPDIDFTQIDTAYFSVQKCFGMPAGLGVWLVNDRCKELAANKSKNGQSVGGHHNISSLSKMAKKHQTPSTPNVLGIYTLMRVCKAMNDLTAPTIRENTLEKAQLLYDAIDDISYLSVGVEKTEHRSKTVIVANTQLLPATINLHLAQYNISIGGGYGNNKTSQIRIANFPAHSKKDIEELINRLKELS